MKSYMQPAARDDRRGWISHFPLGTRFDKPEIFRVIIIHAQPLVACLVSDVSLWERVLSMVAKLMSTARVVLIMCLLRQPYKVLLVECPLC
jgi:hypothetical protein